MNNARRTFMSAFARGAVLGAPALAAFQGEAFAASVRARPGRASGVGEGGVFDVTRFGAQGDGKTRCTKALQAALDAAARAGGGTVMFPPGTYLTGALFLRSNIHLHVSAGAILIASETFADFPAIGGS